MRRWTGFCRWLPCFFLGGANRCAERRPVCLGMEGVAGLRAGIIIGTDGKYANYAKERFDWNQQYHEKYCQRQQRPAPVVFAWEKKKCCDLLSGCHCGGASFRHILVLHRYSSGPSSVIVFGRCRFSGVPCYFPPPGVCRPFPRCPSLSRHRLLC